MVRCVTNHGSLYFGDGNVALLAPKSLTHFIAFRVHRTLISKMSSVFENLFTSPEAETEVYEGVPLVYLTDDADGLESLLQLLYHDMDLPLRQLNPHTLCLLRSLLGLADKYAMHQIRQNLVGQIEESWPLTLRQWDHQESRINTMLLISRGDLDVASSLDDWFPEPASAIQLARECNIPAILPAAFYHLSRLSIDDDWGKTYLGYTLDTGRTAQWSLLTADDLRCLLKGQTRLRQAPQELLKFTSCRTSECFGFCSTEKLSRLLTEIQDKCDRSSDILRVTREYIEKSYGDEICFQCCWGIRRDLGTFRHKLWAGLRDFFSL
ncbi:hypothetical protein BYT27DRAFT_7312406 [Phlegmacium glaucopus]|nr:hypothetical protein BYT27DRAFT_7312406 [Phlegmacium glaucopus]